ncbi:helix-turn-helix domain-containing protein [Gloeocapsa sp. BRSZ]
MKTIVKFKNKAQILTAEQAARVEEQLKLFPPELLPEQPLHAILNTLYQLKEEDKADTWVFSMVGRKKVMAISRAIRNLPPSMRPHQTLETFLHVLLNVRQDTGEIMLTRDEIADEIKTTSDNISNVMGTLEKMGVIRREYRKVAGMRGRGMVVYFINPDVAWNGSLSLRKAEAERTQQQFNFTLIQGGVAS